ncbi:MAG TPA: laccase domain-containing protein [Streptosporangiaceae bacterium]
MTDRPASSQDARSAGAPADALAGDAGGEGQVLPVDLAVQVFWLAPGIRAAFTGRSGGLSQPPFDGLNLSAAGGDSPAAVARNRELVAAACGLPPSHLIWMHQVHGTDIGYVTAPHAPHPGPAVAAGPASAASPGHSAATGQPATRQPATSESSRGQSGSGQPAASESACGQSVAGHPAAGQPAASESACEQSAAGHPAGGQPAASESACGQSAAGQLAKGPSARGHFSAGQPGGGVLAADTAVPVRDGNVTAVPGLALGALAADCPTVLVGDPEARVVGVAHSGRLGTAAGVVPALIRAMVGAGAVPGRMHAVIGPAICGGCYEVPAAMRDSVAAQAPGSGCVTRAGTPGLDLRAGIAAQLAAAGVRQVRTDERCTAETPDLYSYRRDGRTGRFAGLIWLTP